LFSLKTIGRQWRDSFREKELPPLASCRRGSTNAGFITFTGVGFTERSTPQPSLEQVAQDIALFQVSDL